MNVYLRWRKLLKLSDEKARALLHIGNGVTTYRYAQGQLPHTPVLLRMLCVAYKRDEDVCRTWIEEIVSSYKPTVENTGTRSKTRKVRTRGKAREEQPEARDDTTDGSNRLQQIARKLMKAKAREQEED